jgi:hypothetical protein
MLCSFNLECSCDAVTIVEVGARKLLPMVSSHDSCTFVGSTKTC